MYLQILTKPCRTQLIREHFSLNKCLLIFFRQNIKKIQFFGKIDSEKNSKKLHSK